LETDTTMNKYELIKHDVEKFLISGNMHSTLVGKQITLGGSEQSTLQQAKEFAEYIADLIEKAENYKKTFRTSRKGNVKLKGN